MARLAALVLLTVLALAGEAAAEPCVANVGTSNWNDASSWSCGHVPGPADTAVVGAGDDVRVSAAPLASAGSVDLAETGRVTFSADTAMSVGDLSVSAGSIVGAGTLTVTGRFSKSTSGSLHVTNDGFAGKAPDLVLAGSGVLGGGTICVNRSDSTDSDQPHLQVHGRLSLVDDPDSSALPFPCSSGPRIRIDAGGGRLVKTSAGTQSFETMVVNDGVVDVQAGKLILRSGTGGEVSDGAYLAQSDATLQFGDCCAENFELGPTARVGGQGTVRLKANPMTMAAGATLDPAVLDLQFGLLTLEGTSPQSLPVFNLAGATLDTRRPVTANAFNVTSGTLRGDFVLTVPAGGSFTKTTTGALQVGTNTDASPRSPDLILDTDATIEGGALCVGRVGSDPDQPSLQINQDLTIAPTADSSVFTCGGLLPLIHVNGPAGHLKREGAGSTTSQGAVQVAGGKLTVASGQTLGFPNGLVQSGGLTEVASDGVLQGSVTLNGGVFRGAGQITGALTNTAATVQPGGSPGSLRVTGSYHQGPAGTLEVDVAGTQPGTEFDQLLVGGAATLDGSLAVVQGAGFDPAITDTFQVVESGSRTGAFASLTGAILPDSESYALAYPGEPTFGAQLTVGGPTDYVVEDCSDPALAELTVVTGDLLVESVPDCETILLPNLTKVGGSIVITGNTAAGTLDLSSLAEVAGNLTLTGNTAAGTLDLSSLAEVAGNLTLTGNAAAGRLEFPSLGEVAGNLTLTDNAAAGRLEFPSLGEVAGELTLTGNSAAVTLDIGSVTTVFGPVTISDNSAASVVDLGSLFSASEVTITDNSAAVTLDIGSVTTVFGPVTISGNVGATTIDIGLLQEAAEVEIADNGAATVNISSLETVGGDLTLETTGDGGFAAGKVAAGGASTIVTRGYDSISGRTATGSTVVQGQRPAAVMRAELPAGAFLSPVDFTLTRLDPLTLPPRSGTAAGGAAALIDPVVAYEFAFGVPTLNQPATLSFSVEVDALDPTTRSEFLSAVEAGSATLTTRSEGASGHQAFPLCASGVAPTANGCVTIRKLDAAGRPTAGMPAVVEFTGVTGHFSIWAVAIVQAQAASEPATGPGPSGGGSSQLPRFGPGAAVSIALASRRVSAKGPIRVRLSNANAFEVAGRLAAKTITRARRGKRTIVLPARTFKLPGRASTTVRLRLPKSLQRVLVRRRKVTLRLTAHLTDPAGSRRTVIRQVRTRAR